MEHSFQSLLEDATPRAVLRQQLDALKPVDTPAPIRKAGGEKRKSRRIENALIRKKGGDANLQTPIPRQQSLHLSASALGDSLNTTSIKGVDRTYADLSALDSDESSINESIDLDLEAAARFRKRKRSMKYLTEPEVSLSKIAKKPPKSTGKKTPQIPKKSSQSSNVSANKGHIDVNLSLDKTYAHLSSSVMESSSDSIDLGAAQNIRHPKKQGIVFPQIDSVVPAPKLQEDDNIIDSNDLQAAKNIHQLGEQGIVSSKVVSVLSSPKSPHVDRSVDSSINTYNLRGSSRSAPKWKSPQMFQSVGKDLAHKQKPSHSNKNTTLEEDLEPQFDETYDSIVDIDDSLENIQLRTKERFARKASSLNLNLSTLIKDLRVKNNAFEVLEEFQTENAAVSERQTDESEISENQAAEIEMASDAINLRAESRSVGAVQKSQENVGASEIQANEVAAESLETENEIVSDTQSSRARGTEESMIDDRTTILEEEDNLPERPSAKVEGALSTQMRSSSGSFAKRSDEVDVSSMEDESLDSSEYELNAPIPPPFNFRDVNDVDDDSQKSVSASGSVTNTLNTLSTSFSSDSGGDVELDDNISAALVSLDSERGNDMLSHSEESNHSNYQHSSQPQSYSQDELRSVEKDAKSSSLRKSSLSSGKGTTLSPLRRSPRKSVEMNYNLRASRKNSERDIRGGRTSLPLTHGKSLDRRNTSLPLRTSQRRYAGMETTSSPLRRSSRKSVAMETTFSTQRMSFGKKVDIDKEISDREITSTTGTSLQISVDERSVSSMRRDKEESQLHQDSPSAQGRTKISTEVGIDHEIGIAPLNSDTGESSYVDFQDRPVIIPSKIKSVSLVDFEDKTLSNPVRNIPEKEPGLTKLVLTQEEVEVHPEESIRAMQRASRNLHSNLHTVEMGSVLDTVSHVTSHGIGHQQIIDKQEKSTDSDKSEDMDDMSQKLTVEEDDITESALAPVVEEIPANITRAQTSDIDLTTPHMEHTTDNEGLDNPEREGLRGKDEHVFGEVEDLHLAQERALKEREDGSHITQEDPLSDGEDATHAVQEDSVSEKSDGVPVDKDPMSDNEDISITPEGPVSDDEAIRVHDNRVSEGKSMNIVQEDSVNEGEDVAHLTHENPSSVENIAHVAQVDPLSEDDRLNLLSVTEGKTLLLQEKPAEEGILTEPAAYRVTVEDKASDSDTSSEETPLIVHSQEKHSGVTDSSEMSATNTSAHKLASQPGSSKTKQLTMRDFLQKLASKPVQPPGLADKGRPRPWLGDLFGDKGTSSTQKPPRQAALAKRTRQTGKKPLPSCLPMSVTREIFGHYAKCRVVPNGFSEVIKASEKYWKNLSLDLVNFVTARRGSSDVLAKDVKRVMSRQGFITSDMSLFALIEEYLPMEDWNVLIPTAFAKDNVYPSDPAG